MSEVKHEEETRYFLDETYQVVNTNWRHAMPHVLSQLK